MSTNGKKPTLPPEKMLFGFSPWLVVGLSVILGLAIAALSVRSSRREEQNMVANFTSRADALVWALEAGTRTWMGFQGERNLLQALIEETAKQPDIVYLAVTDDQGRIIAHSDSREIGAVFAMEGAAADQSGKSAWRVRDVDGKPVFEVHRLFAPIQNDRHAFSREMGHHRGMGMGMGMGRRRMQEGETDGATNSYVFVGLDHQPFAEALREDSYQNLLTAAIVAALGLGGFVSMFWAYNYRRSRRMLMDAQALMERNRHLAAVGHLAAGVAHEIRNPLSSIKGLATYLAKRVPASGPEEDAAKTMIGEVNRLNRVVSELLDFARPGQMAMAPTDVNAVVQGALRLAGADLQSKHIAVDFAPDPAFPPAPVNPERLTQALLNLILNAVQAMDDGGTLTIRLLKAAGGDAFRLVVADNGKGMTDEVKASVFTPYFTTKAGGTGLGLAIVYQIVEGHGGSVSVESRPGEGSAFTMALPLKRPIA